MANLHLQNQVTSMRDDLIKQGFLDEQFIRVEEQQDDADPNFTEKVVGMFFKDSADKYFNEMEKALGKKSIDYHALENVIHRFMGSSSSVGAAMILRETIAFRDLCRERNVDGCKEALQRVKTEFANLRPKLEAYFQFARQVRPASETPSRPSATYRKYYVLY